MSRNVEMTVIYRKNTYLSKRGYNREDASVEGRGNTGRKDRGGGGEHTTKGNN
jgi:hypothetical protein